MSFIYLARSITSSHIAVIKWIRSKNPFASITNEVQANELLEDCPYVVNADVAAINGSFCLIMDFYRTDILKYAMSDRLPEEKCARISFRVPVLVFVFMPMLLLTPMLVLLLVSMLVLVLLLLLVPMPSAKWRSTSGSGAPVESAHNRPELLLEAHAEHVVHFVDDKK
jgi:hypothetical protein